MSRLLFFSGLVLCLVAIALTQLPDPGVFGVDDESGRILFYGGSGLMAGFFSLVALLSGIYRIAKGTAQEKRTVAIMLLLGIATVAVLFFRFG